MQNHRRRIRLLRRLALGLAVAAVAAPAAQAIPDEGTIVPRGTLPNGSIVQGEYKSNLGDSVVRGHPGALVQGERKTNLPQGDVPGALVQGERKTDLPNGYVPFMSDFPRTAPAPGGQDATPLGDRRVPVEAVRAPSAFDWGDAGIGAGSALALLLIAGGAVVATRHIGRPAAA
ncbi:MAG: hypothetical protein ACRDPP_03350 [Gaiellaceae bacterium]